MPEQYYIVPVSQAGRPDNTLPGSGGGYPDNSLPGSPAYPSHPIELPPIPPDVAPGHPIVIPPNTDHPSHPIVIPGTPEHPIVLPPAQVWPPLPPGSGISGKTYILILVLGVGYRWLVVDGPDIWPPVATPK